MTLMGAGTTKMTPGQLLAARAMVRGADPARFGPGWVALSELYTNLACDALGSLAVAAVAAPNAAGGAPGRWIPSSSRLDLDGTLLPCDPEFLDIRGDADHRRAFAAMHGVFWHEVGHAAHTRWLGTKAMPEVLDAMALLEEARMEAQLVRSRPAAATWLRAAATHLLLTGLDEVSADAAGAAHLGALTVGRVHAGSLLASDLGPVTAILDAALDASQQAAMDALLAELMGVGDHDIDALMDLAARWVATFPRAEVSACGLPGADGERSAEGEGSGTGAGTGPGTGDEDWREAVREALEAAAAAAAADAAEALAGDGGAAGSAAAAEARDLASRLDEVAESMGADAMGTGGEEPDEYPEGEPAGAHGYGADGRSARWGLRAPHTTEQTARRALAARLKVARTRERKVTVVPSALPPGRLDSRGALKADAEATLGRMPTAAPWRRRVRKTVDSPRLRLAVCTDVSGSMGWAASRISSAMWVLGQAVADSGGVAVGAVFGGTATVTFDSSRKRLSRQVMDFVADANTEAVADALEMVDAALDLHSLPGSTDEAVVVIITDGHWVDHRQNARADRWLREARARGIRTILVGVGESGCLAHPCDENVTIREPHDLVPVLGKALVDVLRPRIGA